MKKQNEKTKKLLTLLLSLTMVLTTVTLSEFNKNVKAEDNHRVVISQYDYGEDANQMYDSAINGKYAQEAQIGGRYVYALGINDITDYLGTDKISSASLTKMFFNLSDAEIKSKTPVYERIWLRTGNSENYRAPYSITGQFHNFFILNYDWSISARPAFQIDLSELSDVSCSNKTPVKGDIISLDIDGDGNLDWDISSKNYNEAFRVLGFSAEGYAKVLAMKSITGVQFNPTSVTYTANCAVPTGTYLSDADGNKSCMLPKYNGSNLDTTLNTTYYNNTVTGTKVHNAIKETKDLVQDNFYSLYDRAPFDYKEAAKEELEKIVNDAYHDGNVPAEVKKALDDAKAAVDGADNIDKVNEAETQGKAEIRNAIDLAKEKEAAKEELEKIVNDAYPDGNVPAEVKKALDDAKAAVDNATTSKGIEQAKDDGVKKIKEAEKNTKKYKVIKQDDTYIKGSKATLSFESDAEYSIFLHVVKVDGKEIVENKDYTSKPGSTIVTLSADYLETLAVGDHTIEIDSDDGYALAQFKVIDNGVQLSNPTNVANQAKTGDSTNVLFMIIAMLAVLSLGVVVFTRKRNNL